MPSRRLPSSITAEESRRLDANAEELGVPVMALMANAGKALAKEVARVAGRKPILVLSGHGNKGGDGLAAAAELLRRGLDVRVVLAKPAGAMMGPGKAWLAKLPRERIAVWRNPPEAAPVIVDCLLGTGLSGTPRAPYAAIIRWMNAHRRTSRILSCDVPSGLGTSLAVRPHTTVTMHVPKVGMTGSNSGRIVVAPIGMPRGAEGIGIGDLRAGFVVPRPDSHKGDNGIVVVAAGSPGLSGAPLYCARSAYRTGADLVHLLAPGAIAQTLQALDAEPMVHAAGHKALGEDALRLARPWLQRGGVLLIGPGLGRSRTARAAAGKLLDLAAQLEARVVADADALDVLDDARLRRLAGRLIITPHAREFQDLFGLPATVANVTAMAQRHGITILCKTVLGGRHAAVVSDGTTTRIGRRGHATMTVGGTGDVLAGATAELLAKGATPFDAACAAAYLVGRAGEEAAKLRSWGVGPLDVAEAIPRVLLDL